MPRPNTTVASPKPPSARRPVRSARPGESGTDRSRAEPLALLRALQGSLEPEVVVETFVDRLRQHYAVDGAAFDHPEFGRQWGARRAHAFAAPLNVDGTALGKLEFYRRQAFGSRERNELSELAELLLQPLRNALTHACLQKQAFADGLTGLLNRQALDRMLPRELAAADRQGRPLTLVVIDMDRLKSINDTWGHAAGDRALKSLAEAIASSLRQSDLAFRLGGDEFLLLLPATGEAGGMRVVERIRERLARATGHAGAAPQAAVGCERISFSAGIAASTPGVAAADLIELADRAMYGEKRKAANREGAAASTRAEASSAGAATVPCRARRHR